MSGRVKCPTLHLSAVFDSCLHVGPYIFYFCNNKLLSVAVVSRFIFGSESASVS